MPTIVTDPIETGDLPIATQIFGDLAFIGNQTILGTETTQLIPFTLLGLATTTTVLQKALNLSDLLDPIAARGNLGAKNLWYVTGTAAPGNTIGIVNDFAFNDNGVLYEKTAATTWTSRIDFVTQAELTAANYLTTTAANALYAPIGENAGPGLRYTYNTSTTFPAATGQVLLSAATFVATTSISVHTSDRNSRDFATILDLGVAGSRLQLTFDGAEETYAWFNITAIATSGSTRTYTVTHIQSNGTPANGEMSLQIMTVGGTGSATGIRLDRTFSTSTAASPASGTLRLSSGNPQTTPTIVRINNTRTVGSASVDQSPVLDKIAIGNIIQVSHSTNGLYATYKVTAISTTAVSGTTAYNFSCDYLFGTAGTTSWANNDTVIFHWLPDNSSVAASTGGATGLKYTYNPTAGSGIISAADLATATALTINVTDATTPTAKNSAAVLARFKTGAIIQVAKDDSNWVRYSVTSDYASGSVSVTVDQSAGTISSGDTVYISIVSDAPSSGGGGSGIAWQDQAANGTATNGIGYIITPATQTVMTLPSGITGSWSSRFYGKGSGGYRLSAAVGGVRYNGGVQTLLDGTQYSACEVVWDGSEFVVISHEGAVSLVTPVGAKLYYQIVFLNNAGNSVWGTNEVQFYETVGGANLCVGGTPFGDANAGGNAGRDACFDGSAAPVEGQGWYHTSQNFPKAIGYQLPVAKVVTQVGFSGLYGRGPATAGNTSVTQFRVEGSNDGSNWTVLNTITTSVVPAEGQVAKFTL